MPQFEENIAAAVDALGLENAGIIFGIGMTDWETTAERDDFLSRIVAR